MEPTIGRIVHYKLNESDTFVIEDQRRGISTPGTEDGTRFPQKVLRGNSVAAGDVFPAMIVRTWGGGAAVQLQVFLDGNDTLWATSRMKGNEPGQWFWPPRV